MYKKKAPVRVLIIVNLTHSRLGLVHKSERPKNLCKMSKMISQNSI